MAPATTVTRRMTLPSEEFATKLAACGPAGIRAGKKTLDALREGFTHAFAFVNPVLQSESGQFLDRLRSSGYEIPEPFEQASAAEPEVEATVTPQAVNIAWQAVVEGRAITWRSRFVTGERDAFNVQIVNQGPSTLSSSGATPFYISYRLIGSDGHEIEGHRTPILIDLAVGRGITQPLRVTMPDEPGEYRLDIVPMIEDLAWLNPIDSRDIEVLPSERASESDARSPDQALPDCTITDTVREYLDDHTNAIELLSGWLKEIDDFDGTIVEIGGNLHPMCSDIPGVEVINIDIDPFGLLTSEILYGGLRSVRNVVGDGTALPFADGSLSAIVLIATFHHFPDPVGLLQHLSRKLKPSGRLFLLCEPVGHVFADAMPEGFLRELQHGAYEQAFLPWEYAQMLEQGGFKVVGGVVDRGSAKLVAAPSASHAMAS